MLSVTRARKHVNSDKKGRRGRGERHVISDMLPVLGSGELAKKIYQRYETRENI